MIGNQLRLASRTLLRSSSRVRANATIQATYAVRSYSSLTPEELLARGVVDEKGFTRFDTLHEMQVNSCLAFANKDSFGTYDKETERFEFITYEEYGRRVDDCRAVLRDLGVKEHDKVAIIANNRWEWVTIAAACYSMNASMVPMYEAQLANDWQYILNDSQSTVLFCATQDIFDRVHREVLPSTPSVQATLCLDAKEGEPHAFATAMANTNGDGEGRLILKPTQEDLANLIYTSGTTGKPKGVELTHLNFTSNVKAAGRSMLEDPRDLVSENDTSLAFLPWAHSYGQTVELWLGMSAGIRFGICRGVPQILEDLQLVKPTVLFSVPTLYKKVFDGVNNLIENESAVKGYMMRRAIELGRQNSLVKAGSRGPLNPLESLQFRLLDRIVLSKIRARFGGNMRFGCVAGSACAPEVLSFMDAIGIPILEGYGLTETSPIITINMPDQRSIGSVGRAIGGVTLHIVDEEGNAVATGEEGEICCSGPNVMRGYYNNQEATDEVISLLPDGTRMFHTGDLGNVDAEGWLRVTGRKKEQYKLENGKYVVPTPIETAIGMSRFVSQVVLHGANRPFNVALLVPEWGTIRSELGLDNDVSEAELANDPRVKDLIDAEIQSNCDKLKKFEIPTKWAFVAPFTAANNMITPKMSIRRHKVVEAYEDVIAHLYDEEPVASAESTATEERKAA